MKNKINKVFFYLKNINFKDGFNDLKDCDILFFCNDANRGVQLNNRAYSQLSDSIREKFESYNYKCITIAHPFGNLVGEKAYGDPIAVNRRILYSIFKREFLIKSFLLGLDKKNDPLVSLFGEIIDKTKPKLIITIGSNDALSLAARNKNIYHLELLHGIGYTSIPWGWGEKNKEFLPQGVICLDDVAKNTFSILNDKGLDIYQIPHPFLSRFVTGDIPDEWRFNNRSKKYSKEILVSLQWAFAGDHGNHDHLANILSNGLFYEQLIDVIKLTKDEILWRFRFHPVQYRNTKKYKKLFDFINNFLTEHPNCEWYESTYLPLPTILLECSGHITMHSMSSYEAAYIGVKTLALSPTIRVGGRDEKMFDDLVEKGYVLKQAPDVKNILKWVKSVDKVDPLLIGLNSENWFEVFLKQISLKSAI